MSSQTPESLADAVLKGERRAIARAITLIESTRPDHRADADRLLEKLLPHAGRSIRIGISGVPGVGKSTFIEAFGNHVIDQGHRIAVLAVDPSSKRSGGSILGDKTRMETLSVNQGAYIRPSPAGRTLGGVARRTREAMLICEAAGFNVVLVETVGVGQSETTVAEMTDLFMLLLLPSGGDELQGIKKGIVELADLVLVNKADGDMAAAAGRAVAEYKSALHLLRSAARDWQVPVRSCSALTGEGIDAAWDMVADFRRQMTENGFLDERRRDQNQAWMWNEISENLLQHLKDSPDLAGDLARLEAEVRAGQQPPVTAARHLVARFLAGPGKM
ncbi:methylmalonyl Co-A mutase-associated GTPase MeaB [Aestuariispira insulae]|uniref:Methylmalonyl-CoA mutase metallochaperone MeaB n=1 Tax=Aestuariispira insulae TaxID=1461337 RepID=A0A3D9HRH1_9PROT|nr:methylmalonyl Co-A mutase-associated GTPase MeaB [Aestuariispira insulae]RED51476.1 methylmalonyl-CoA mutase metallochaperone MeaB [Aestuariispira insulae]